jgi:hypothetical protein
MRKNQFGMTFFGVVFIGGSILAVSILGMKMVPAYIEFFSVKNIITEIGKDPAVAAMTPLEIRKSFDRRATIGYVTVIEGKDLEISKQPGGNVVSTSYSVLIPIVANVNILLEFQASTAGTKPAKIVGE